MRYGWAPNVTVCPTASPRGYKRAASFAPSTTTLAPAASSAFDHGEPEVIGAANIWKKSDVTARPMTVKGAASLVLGVTLNVTAYIGDCRTARRACSSATASG